MKNHRLRMFCVNYRVTDGIAPAITPVAQTSALETIRTSSTGSYHSSTFYGISAHGAIIQATLEVFNTPSGIGRRVGVDTEYCKTPA